MKRFISPCLALASVSIACVVAGASRPLYGGTLRVEVDAALRTIDPIAPSSEGGEAAARARVSSLAFETLTAVEPDGLRPLLATSWESEGGGLRWRFHLRGGVRLHDGSPIQPWQVAASLRASGPWKAAAEGDTIAIDTDMPIADLPWALADPRHAIVIRGSGGTLAGTGPFRFERLEGTRMSFRAHDAYWRARPFVDALQVDTGRAVPSQLTDIEAGRIDIVTIRPTDVPRLARRGLRVEASRPLELVALVFEPHRATDGMLIWRRTLASAFDRDAMCSVLLQGYGVPARTVSPAWLSGYAPFVALANRPTLSRSAVAALPVEDRDVTLRVDAADTLSQSIAERIAADGREAGFAVKVQAPVGLAPRSDVRLMRIALTSTTPDRVFAHASSLLATRGWPTIAAPEDATLPAVYRAEQSLLDRLIVVPVVHVPALVGLGERIGFSTVPAIRPLGGWNLADVFLRGGTP